MLLGTDVACVSMQFHQLELLRVQFHQLELLCVQFHQPELLCVRAAHVVLGETAPRQPCMVAREGQQPGLTQPCRVLEGLGPQEELPWVSMLVQAGGALGRSGTRGWPHQGLGDGHEGMPTRGRGVSQSILV